MAEAKRGRGRPPSSKVTKPSKTSTRQIGRRAAALSEKSTNQGNTKRNTSSQKPSPSKGSGDLDETTILSWDAQHLQRNDLAEAPETQHPVATDLDGLEYTRSPAKTTFEAIDSGTTSADLRRRIGDLRKKCEVWEAKYRDLYEIGIKEAERNFERLKKQNQDQAKAANQLISSLQADVARQRQHIKENQHLQTQRDLSEGKIVGLNASLTEARKEIKTLTVKLSASRSAEASQTRIPGSATRRGQHAPTATIKPELVQAAQMKDDLYGDLTGLIVRDTRREPAGDVFDCIQTGRNGTLHFKLVVESEGSCDNYQDAQFTYKPQLDSSRDRDLIDILPDYLVEEITFPRPHAAKFYSRVTRSLTEQVD